MICEKTHMQLPSEGSEDSKAVVQLPEKRKLRLGETEEAAAVRRANDNAHKKKDYRLRKQEIQARRKQLRLLNIEQHRAKTREMYRKRQEKLGRKIDPKFGKPILTDEERKLRTKQSYERWRSKNPEKVADRRRQLVRERKDRLMRTDPTSHLMQKERTAKYHHLYRKRERAKRKAWHLAYVERHKNDPNYALSRRFRSRIRVAIKNGYGKKALKSVELLGCSIAEAKVHLEKQFRPGMTWDRFITGEIEIDHIRPCASFDMSREDEQRRCFSWKNLQPLWWWENCKKGDKLPLDLSPTL